MAGRIDGATAASGSRSLRSAVRKRASVLATFLLLPRIEIVELVAAAGFGGVIVDLEHGPTDVSDVPGLVVAAHQAGLYAMVRVSTNSAVEIGKVLDAGADGILVPHIASASEAHQLVAAGRYPPLGERSLNPYTRGNNYGMTTDAYERANHRVALIAMLEGVEAITNLEQIGEIEELDAVFVGPMDLSASLGLPGEPEHPLVVEAVQDALGRAHSIGCASGTYAPTPEAAARWLSAGAALVALSADIAMAAAGLARAFEAVATTPQRIVAS